MTEMFRCGDEEALVSFIYDECPIEVRQAIAVHVAWCLSCGGTVAALGGTRAALATWTPPDVALDLRNPAVGAGPGSTADGGRVIRGPWWRQPLPAWAQVAAAAIIFISGLAVGTARSPVPARVAERQPPSTTPSTTPSAPSPVTPGVAERPVVAAATPGDLAALEARLRDEFANAQKAAVPVSASRSDERLLARVHTLIQQSEARQDTKTIGFVTSLQRMVVDQGSDLALLSKTVDKQKRKIGSQGEVMNVVLANTMPRSQ